MAKVLKRLYNWPVKHVEADPDPDPAFLSKMN